MKSQKLLYFVLILEGLLTRLTLQETSDSPIEEQTIKCTHDSVNMGYDLVQIGKNYGDREAQWKFMIDLTN